MMIIEVVKKRVRITIESYVLVIFILATAFILSFLLLVDVEDEETQVRGVTSILDCQGFTMAHMKDYALDFNYGKKFTYIWQVRGLVQLRLLNIQMFTQI